MQKQPLTSRTAPMTSYTLWCPNAPLSRYIPLPPVHNPRLSSSSPKGRCPSPLPPHPTNFIECKPPFKSLYRRRLRAHINHLTIVGPSHLLTSRDTRTPSISMVCHLQRNKASLFIYFILFAICPSYGLNISKCTLSPLHSNLSTSRHSRVSLS